MTQGPDAGRVVVVGGGLAGLTCALDLADAGVPTTLVEKRPFVGGKTFSFSDPSSRRELDNGQHVYLRCCGAYTRLLARLGLQEQMRLQPRLRVPVLDPATSVVSPIASTTGPAPINLAWSILCFVHLSLREKLLLGRAVWPLLRMSDSARRALDAQSFGHWLRARGQSQRVIDRFWDLIVLPTCNDVSDRVSAAQAAYVFKTGLLHDAHGADIGLARVGLSHIADAAMARFREKGGEACLGSAVRGLTEEAGRVTGVLVGGSVVRSASVVLALPPDRALALLPDSWRDREGLSELAAFEFSPIVNVHLQLDRAVLPPDLDSDFLAVLDPDLQYVFNRSRIATDHDAEPDGSQWLDVSLSGAHEPGSRPQAEIAETTIAALRHAFPRARDAQVVHWRVVKEMDATFRPAPGVDSIRPGAITGVDNLFLAGAYTDTQWPATMESAVRSGHAAAEACREALARS